MAWRWRLGAFMLGAFGFGCEPQPVSDAGAMNVSDASAFVDAGHQADAGGSADAGAADAAVAVDSGMLADAGGAEDAGAPFDASVTLDAGTRLDADPCTWKWSVRGTPVVRGLRNVASDPTVIFRDGGYEMVFSSLDPTSGVNVLAFTHSADGEHWADASVALRGVSGTWAEELESAEWVPLGDGGWGVVYAGYRSQVNDALCQQFHVCSEGFPSALGLATQASWGQFAFADANPFFWPTDGGPGFDQEAVYSPTIAFDGAQWVMIYSGWCLRNCPSPALGFLSLLSATSTDGLHWVRQPTPVLERAPSVAWRNRAVGEASLAALPNGRWVLAFTAFTDTRDPDTSLALAWATSPLGPYTVCEKPWLEPQRLPDGGGIESGGIIAPEIRVVGDEVKLWFTSRNLSLTSDFGYWVRLATVD